MKTFAAKLKNLIKSSEFTDENRHYWFASHPRLGHWAYNFLSRRRKFLREDIKNQWQEKKVLINLNEAENKHFISLGTNKVGIGKELKKATNGKVDRKKT